jgi:hypothetical protein
LAARPPPPPPRFTETRRAPPSHRVAPPPSVGAPLPSPSLFLSAPVQGQVVAPPFCSLSHQRFPLQVRHASTYFTPLAVVGPLHHRKPPPLHRFSPKHHRHRRLSVSHTSESFSSERACPSPSPRHRCATGPLGHRRPPPKRLTAIELRCTDCFSLPPRCRVTPVSSAANHLARLGGLAPLVPSPAIVPHLVAIPDAGSRASPKSGDRALGKRAMRRPAWAIVSLWLLGQASRARPWAE